MIREFKPKKIIEIGSGISTVCMQNALNVKKNNNYEINCIEPFPYPALKKLASMDKNIKIVEKQCQSVDLKFFKSLNENDLLFIDSTHTVKPGSEVNYLILEVLPRLNPGVIVHFHDIFFPFDYQRNVLKTYFHWSESTLLHAYLKFNSHAKILVSLSLLHYDAKDELIKIFPGYTPQEDFFGLSNHKNNFPKEHFPSSFFFKIV